MANKYTDIHAGAYWMLYSRRSNSVETMCNSNYSCPGTDGPASASALNLRQYMLPSFVEHYKLLYGPTKLVNTRGTTRVVI